MCILPDDSQVYFCETHTCLTEKLVHLADDYRIAGKRTITYEYAIAEFILEDGFPSKGGFPVLARSSSQLAASACMSTFIQSQC